jgi:hypothetical protein
MVGRLMNWEGYGRKPSWPDRGDIPVFTRTDWAKPWNTYFRILRVPAESRTRHLPSVNVERFHYTNLLGWPEDLSMNETEAEYSKKWNSSTWFLKLLIPIELKPVGWTAEATQAAPSGVTSYTFPFLLFCYMKIHFMSFFCWCRNH